ncbi:MAG TPA: FtsX-like permease family protein [bacterium]|nr:FtsX-like permease family protein [bacterium]
MTLFVKLAWRNLFRNKRRTILAGLMIGLGLAAMITTDAITIGTIDNMIATATASFLGEGQVHRENFRKTFEVEATIVNGPALFEKLKKDPLIRQTAPRTAAFGMITSPANVQSVMLYGIDPTYERDLSKIDDLLVSGGYLATADEPKILLGEKTADLLEVGVGDKIVVTVAQAHTGELSQELFRVGGIFKFGSRQMDGGMAFIPLKRAQEMLKLGNNLHEIAFSFHDKLKSEDKSLPLWGDLSAGGNEALPWTELVSELAMMRSMTDFSLFLVGIILFGIVAVGIINTLFMSLYERMFEFGVMRAVGTRPRQAAQLMVMEAGALSLIAIVMGIVVAIVVNGLLLHYGIDYSGSEFVVTLRDPIYPVLTAKQFTVYPFLLFIFTCLVGLYPAIYAAKLTPAKAMKRGL